MELFSIGFPTALSFVNLFYCFLGVFIGTLIGVLPGVGAITAISLLFPLSFGLEPTTAIIMLAGIYYGAEYGGSTSSILLNLPGNTSSAITCLEGYPMTQQGRAGVALFMATVASLVGGTVGILVLMFLSPVIARLGLLFGPIENLSVMLLALIAAGSIGRGSWLKGMAMVVLGLLLSMVGIDTNLGTPRYTFDVYRLYNGFDIAIIAMGVFGMAEVIGAISNVAEGGSIGKIRLKDMLPTRAELVRSVLPATRGTGIGALFGVLPGTGTTIASFVGYAVEKRVARDPQRFGRGAIEGLVSPEAANNAAAQTAFVPTLTLGIPSTATMAIVLGALMVHGISPGPLMMSSHPELFWGLIASFWIGNIILVVINIPMIGLWVRLVRIPYRLLYPSIIALICVGAYCINTSLFDVWLVLAFGLLGYLLRILEFDAAPLLVAFILGPMIERNIRNTMITTGGDLSQVLDHSIAVGCLLILAGSVLWWLISTLQRQRLARGQRGLSVKQGE
jgi:TctA family transporter